jgi:hypothetical protein
MVAENKVGEINSDNIRFEVIQIDIYWFIEPLKYFAREGKTKGQEIYRVQENERLKWLGDDLYFPLQPCGLI